MSKRARRSLSREQKLAILREHLVDGKAVSEVCERLGEGARAGRYRQFWQAVKAAEGEAEVRAVAIIQKKMPEDWRAAMSYLERQHPKRWGRGWTSPRATSPSRGFRSRCARRRRRGRPSGGQG